MRHRGFIALAITISFVASLITIPAIAAPDKNKYHWPPAFNNAETLQKPLLGYAFSIADDFTQGPAAMEANSFISVAGNMQPLCTGFDDPICLNEINSGRGDWWSNVALALCETKDQASPCIEGLRIEEKSGTYRELKLKKTLPGNSWKADPEIGLPAGSSPTIWTDPLETNTNKGFMLSVSAAMNTRERKAKFTKIDLTSFQSSISAYEMVESPGAKGVSIGEVNGVRKLTYGAPPECIWADTNECGIQTEFKEDDRLQLIVHIPTQISSWLQGRMKDPVISVESLVRAVDPRDGISRVSISANPVEIPLIAAKVELAEASEEQKKYFNDPSHNMGNPDFPNNMKAYNYVGTSSSYDLAFEMHTLFKKQLPTNAQLMLPRWSVRSLAGTTSSQYQLCQGVTQGKFQGVVTTNASIYQGQPPTFNGDSFDFKVAGVHKKTNGEIFQGSYDLVLESQFARCLYKFTSAPIRASVSITNPDGNANIETSVFSEKNGWIKLSINGFTFSSPKISVKLEQDKVVLPTPTPSPTVKPVAKKTTITCIKGKVTKKVTAVNPKCPAGYKKK